MPLALREKIFSGWTWRLPPGSGRIALTFDDGPDPATTPALLQALTKSNIAATHFLTGEKCAAHPELVCELIANKQELGNHGYRHQSMWLKSRRTQIASIEQTHLAIFNASRGYACSHYRPPYGSFNPLTCSALRRTGYTGVLWSCLPCDWKARNADELFAAVRNCLHDGAIILLHDAQPSTHHVITMLPRLADEAVRRGWTFVSLPSSSPPL